MTHSNFYFPLKNLQNGKSYKLESLYTGSPYDVLALGLGAYKLPLEWAWSQSRDVFLKKFCEISDHMSEMVQDRDIVTIEDE